MFGMIQPSLLLLNFIVNGYLLGTAGNGRGQRLSVPRPSYPSVPILTRTDGVSPCYDTEGENRVNRLRYKDMREGERLEIYTRQLDALCPTG
jgi:hypothetical protein